MQDMRKAKTLGALWAGSRHSKSRSALASAVLLIVLITGHVLIRWSFDDHSVPILDSLLAFILLIAGYVFFRWPWARYGVLLLGPLLAFLLPEVIDKERNGTLRLLLACVPIAGIVPVQVAADRRSSEELRKQIESVRVRQSHEMDLRQKEAELYEDILLDPTDVASAQKMAWKGLQTKSRYLSAIAACEEAKLLLAEPKSLETRLTYPRDPGALLGAYLAEPGSHAPSETGVPSASRSGVVGPLRDSLRYLRLATLFRTRLNPEYERISALPKREEQRVALRSLAARLSALTEVQGLAGLHNQGATLALGYGSKEAAFREWYTALLLDPHHVPVYESLAYGLWAFNQDARTALLYSRRGLDLAGNLQAGLSKRYDEAKRAIAELSRPQSGQDARLGRLEQDLDRAVEVARSALDPYLKGFIDRLRLQVAYFDALELQNESEATRFMESLLVSAPGDPEYADGMAFVLVRFATTGAALDRAELLLATAMENPDAEASTRQLVSVHRHLLQSKRGALGRK